MIHNILFIHQSADMYGSDKVLLSLIKELDQTRFQPIVLLPCDGPLHAALIELGAKCYVAPLVRAGRMLFTAKGLLGLPFQIWHSVLAISKIIQSERIHIVHSNTLAVLSGAIWAWLNNVPHVWHVHEIIERPIVVRKGFALLLRLFSCTVICNSKATMLRLLEDQPCLHKKSVVVWNGVERKTPFSKDKAMKFRNSLGLSENDVLVALLGRINRWKGQTLLVDAAEELDKRGITGIRYIMVGSPPDGQNHFLQALEERIAQSSIHDKLTILPFTSDIWSVWDACDIAVVPSTEPEPFGMVALEAMISARPVVAANHGGLAEIILPGITGFLVDPNNKNALADALSQLVSDKDLRLKMGHAGMMLANKKFSVDSYVSGISSVYDQLLS